MKNVFIFFIVPASLPSSRKVHSLFRKIPRYGRARSWRCSLPRQCPSPCCVCFETWTTWIPPIPHRFVRTPRVLVSQAFSAGKLIVGKVLGDIQRATRVYALKREWGRLRSSSLVVVTGIAQITSESKHDKLNCADALTWWCDIGGFRRIVLPSVLEVFERRPLGFHFEIS